MSSATILILRHSHAAERASHLPLPPDAEADLATHDQLLSGSLAGRISNLEVLLIDAPTYSGRDAAALVASDVGAILATDASCPVLVVVDDGAAAVAGAAAAAGAVDILYTSELPAELARRCVQAMRLRRLRREAGAPSRATAVRSSRSREAAPLQMVGSSRAIGEVFRMIRRAAPFDVPVLLTGEPGTGKGLAGLAIHDRSPRAEGPFVTVDCGALPLELLDSQLFGRASAAGHAKGPSPGRFEAAAGGTIYLDEVAELPALLQAKLVGVLSEHMLERVGGRERIPIDVRVLAASPGDLAQAVRRGSFREDLFDLLRALVIRLPPLRERDDDVLVIARYFLARYAADRLAPIRGFAKSADEAMLAHDWPGNVRELVNRVRRAALVSSRPRVSAEDLELSASGPAGVQTLRDARRQAEARCVRTALRRTHGDLAEAARLLGVDRSELTKLIGRKRPPSRPHAPRL